MLTPSDNNVKRYDASPLAQKSTRATPSPSTVPQGLGPSPAARRGSLVFCTTCSTSCRVRKVATSRIHVLHPWLRRIPFRPRLQVNVVKAVPHYRLIRLHRSPLLDGGIRRRNYLMASRFPPPQQSRPATSLGSPAILSTPGGDGRPRRSRWPRRHPPPRALCCRWDRRQSR